MFRGGSERSIGGTPTLVTAYRCSLRSRCWRRYRSVVGELEQRHMAATIIAPTSFLRILRFQIS